MSMTSFWNSLGTGQKAGLAAGTVAVVALTAALAYWSLRPDYVAVVSDASPDRLAAAVREIDKLKVPYRVSEDGTSLEVPASQVGRVRMGVAHGSAGGPSVGFEIFNNTDFSTTEFTQKVNYQRALQGELARTVSSIEGVASVRVHLVMAESGFLRRQSVLPTAAVTVTMQPGAQLTAGQVRGIQRLVAASVPEIKLKDIAVLDQAGEALTKTTSGTDTDPTHAGLEVKREVDAYLEAKLRKLLSNMDPSGEFSVSVDATLQLDNVTVTTEDVVPSDEGKGGHATGVLVRERQSQRQENAASAEPSAGASGPSSGSVTREMEYKVGRRVEQIATGPGGIERVSVAVVARSATVVDESRVRSLAGHAVGLNAERGDSLAVVFLPMPAGALRPGSTFTEPAAGAVPPGQPSASADTEVASGHALRPFWLVVGCLALLALLGAVTVVRSRRHPPAVVQSPPKEPTSAEIEVITQRVREWLDERPNHAPG